MPSVTEAAAYGSQLQSALRAGLRAVDQNQTVSFQPYIRYVLPIDGFVFWLHAGIVSAAQLEAAGLISAGAVEANGSLHFSTAGEVREDENIAIHKVLFTAEQPIRALAEIAPQVLYIGTWTSPEGGSFKFSFSQRSSYYQQANLSHYSGDAVYPVFLTQIIDSVAEFDQRQVVSNSLPIWLAMTSAVPYPTPFNINVPLYPAFLAPDNLPPPYGVVEIPPESTRTLQNFASLDEESNHWQLYRERVKFTLYGLRNDDVLDFQDYLVHYCDLTDSFGIMSPPFLRDEHRPQTELSALAMRKVMELDISYYQARARQIAQQLIKSVVPSYSLSTPV